MTLGKTQLARRVFMILSPRALWYARPAIECLLTHSLEELNLHLITDSASDKDLLLAAMSNYPSARRHRWEVFAKDDLNDQAEATYGRYPNLRLFRDGHPCWRKITDPLLLTAEGEEMVVIDPDVYFPNRFSFEQTLHGGLLLIWQKPSCLLPSTIVDVAIGKRIPLAHHVDIGVAQWRSPIDLDWLEWLLCQLGTAEYSNREASMHVEAIVWSAMAMRMGGGYLPREHWRCWRRSQLARLLLKLQVPGPQLLRAEPFSQLKSFHCGGEAKYWLHAAIEQRRSELVDVFDQPGPITPFIELTRSAYKRNRAVKSCLGRFGYYNLFPGGAFQ